MPTRLVAGIDGAEAGERALAHAGKLAKLIGDCEVLVCYVIEWSPYTFHTAEENAERHGRREAEIAAAKARIVEPAVKRLAGAGLAARGVVRHGDVAEQLDAIAKDEGAEQIIVARSSESGLASRVFGSRTAKLVMSAAVPVTVVA